MHICTRLAHVFGAGEAAGLRLAPGSERRHAQHAMCPGCRIRDNMSKAVVNALRFQKGRYKEGVGIAKDATVGA